MKWFKALWRKRNKIPAKADEKSTETKETFFSRVAREIRESNSTQTRFSHFTPRAQQVLALAGKEAARFNHNFVGTEHLLLGLIKLGQGVGVKVLQKFGLDLETLRVEVEKQVGTGPDHKTNGNIPFTPRVKRVLDLAGKEAKSLGHKYVGTAHILLGLLREGDGVAARVFKNLDVDIETARIEVREELNSNHSAADEGEHEEALRSGEPTAEQESQDSNAPLNFTPCAQRVLKLAHEEADRLRHNFVGLEHLLLGLVESGDGVAFSVLVKLGIDAGAVLKKVEKIVGLGTFQKMIGNIPYTPRTKKVLALAVKEARSLGHHYVGSGHILLGLMREGDGVAAYVLKDLDFDFDRAREEVQIQSNTKPPAGDGEPSAGRQPELTIAIPTELAGEPGQDMAYGLLNNFTPRAIQVINLARKEAVRLNHSRVGTEHIFLGLMMLGQGVAVTVLHKLGLDLETIRMEVEEQAGPGEGQVNPGNIHYTPGVKKVIAQAARDARYLNHTYVGTEHILLGLLRETDGIPARILKSLDIDINETRSEILKELDPNF
jgi:ATP-dependent Clp protease ATP-binding subunit ClpA